MTLGKLKKLCLSFLEQDIDTNIMNTEIKELETDDVFKEYLNNINGSLYNAISRLVQAKKLPIKSYILKQRDMGELGIIELPEDCYQLKQVSVLTKEGFNANLLYQVIGNQLIIPNRKSEDVYMVSYYPRFLYFDRYKELDDLLDENDIDLAKHGIPDEVAIILRYAVYGDMKMDENPTLAITNRNYFEAVLEQTDKENTFTNQNNVLDNDEDFLEWQ